MTSYGDIFAALAAEFDPKEINISRRAASSSLIKDKLTCARYFLMSANPTQRRYEALRAYFSDDLPSAQVAARFGSTPGSSRVLVPPFRHDPKRPFFVHSAHEVLPRSRQQQLRDRVVALRTQNVSLSELSRALSREDQPISPATGAGILKEEDFARLPRRRDEELG